MQPVDSVIIERMKGIIEKVQHVIDQNEKMRDVLVEKFMKMEEEERVRRDSSIWNCFCRTRN
jgi:hypothetical protein